MKVLDAKEFVLFNIGVGEIEPDFVRGAMHFSKLILSFLVGYQCIKYLPD